MPTYLSSTKLKQQNRNTRRLALFFIYHLNIIMYNDVVI